MAYLEVATAAAAADDDDVSVYTCTTYTQLQTNCVDIFVTDAFVR
jgi:hypothetical protein